MLLAGHSASNGFTLKAMMEQIYNVPINIFKGKK